MRLRLFVLLLGLLGSSATAQIATHTWPFGTGQAVASDKYEVYVTLGSGPEQRLDVVMSNAIPEGDWMSTELVGRTFSLTDRKLDLGQIIELLRTRGDGVYRSGKYFFQGNRALAPTAGLS